MWYLPEGFLTAGIQILNGSILYNGTGWCTTLVGTEATGVDIGNIHCGTNSSWWVAGKECVSNGQTTTYWWPEEVRELLRDPQCGNNTVDSWMMATTILNTLSSTGEHGRPFEWMKNVISQIYTIPSNKDIITCAKYILSWNLSIIAPSIVVEESNCTNTHLCDPLQAILNANTINGSRALNRQRRAMSGKDLATVMMWTDPRLGFYAIVNEGNEEAMKKMQDQITNLMRQQVDINKIMTNMSEINADEHQLTRQMIREGLCGVEISLQEGFSQLSLRLSLNNYLQNIQAIINAVLDGRIGPLVISWNLAENITKKYAPTLNVLDFYRVARFHQRFLLRNKTYYMILAIPVPAAEQRQVYIPVSLPKRVAKRTSRATYPNDVRVVGTPEQWTKTRKGGATYLEHTILVSPAQVDIPYESEPYEAPTGDAPTFAIVTPWGIWGKCRDDTNGTLIHYGETTYWCYYSTTQDAWEHTRKRTHRPDPVGGIPANRSTKRVPRDRELHVGELGRTTTLERD